MVPVGLFFCYEGGGSLCGVWGGGGSNMFAEGM